jgi:hypothetical protein
MHQAGLNLPPVKRLGIVTPAAIFSPARTVWNPPMTGVTPTQVSYEIAIGTLKFGTVRQVMPDSMDITWANGAGIKVAGAALVTELWRQFQANGGVSGLGGYDYR